MIAPGRPFAFRRRSRSVFDCPRADPTEPETNRLTNHEFGLKPHISRQPHLVTWEVEAPFRQATVFVTLTFAIAATVYLPHLAPERGWIGLSIPAELTAVAVLSPGIAAVALRVHDRGRAGVRTVIDGLSAWRAWWAVTLGFPPLFFAAMAATYRALGRDFTPEPLRLLAEVGVGAVPVMLIILVLAFGEEVGWRGYLLPPLQARMGACPQVSCSG